MNPICMSYAHQLCGVVPQPSHGLAFTGINVLAVAAIAAILICGGILLHYWARLEG